MTPRGRTRPSVAQMVRRMTSSRSARGFSRSAQVFRAIAIVEVCRFASDSRLADLNSRKPDLVHALLAAHERLRASADELEAIASDYRRPRT